MPLHLWPLYCFSHVNVASGIQSYSENLSVLAEVSYALLRDRADEVPEDGDITINLVGGGKAEVGKQLQQTPGSGWAGP